MEILDFDYLVFKKTINKIRVFMTSLMTGQ